MVNKSKEEKDKLEIIIEAAVKRFGHYGLAKTTMNEIAEDIGMSKASLYYYFPDKETLFAAVVEKQQGVFLEEIEKLLQSTPSGKQLLLQYVRKRHQFFKEFLNLSKLRLDSIKNIKPHIVKCLDEFALKEIALVERILKIGFDSKEFENIDARHHAELFIMLMQGLRAFFLKKKNLDLPEEKDYDTLERHLNHLSDFFIKGITLK